MIEREEELFQIWVQHPYAGKTLRTQCGKALRILSPGILNTDSGPDFFDARIELDGQVWVGNIEIHVRASDWFRHGHGRDKAFHNVVLHVVVTNDADIPDAHGNVVPVLVLTEELIQAESQPEQIIPHSYGIIKTVGTMQSLESLGIARLRRRAEDLEMELGLLRGDMEALFQRHLFRRFGMRTNSEPFQQLAHRVPGKIIRRQRNNLDDLEALLFGQSGLLPAIPVDAYSADLLYRYVGLKSKYQLEPMYEQAWKFMRMRPSNFPTIRISQLAVLLHTTENLYGKCANETRVEELKATFHITASKYWDEHFRFGVYSPTHPKHLGEEAVHSLLINTVAVLRYFLGVKLDDDVLKENALDLLRELPAESNKSIRASGKSPANALESQGVMELLTRRRDTNEEPPACSEAHFPYFSRTNHDQNKIHRPNSLLVRDTRVRRVRLVG